MPPNGEDSAIIVGYEKSQCFVRYNNMDHQLKLKCVTPNFEALTHLAF